MKQLLQRLDTGETSIVEAPTPSVAGPDLLIETRASVVSAGTEGMLVDFGRANLVQKARKQPERVRQVLDKVRMDGLMPTLDAVRAKLEAPIPLGYCNAGVVVACGSDPRGFSPGDRVVSNGSHSEYVRVPHTLTARIPDAVGYEAAAFTPVAAIGLQGVRLAEPTIGETFVVYGLGLIGLLTVQLLRANGCRVIGIDLDPDRLQLAERFGALVLDGAEGSVADDVRSLTEGIGADAVLLTLASDSDEPVHQAARMSRKRGRLVLVGVTGLDLARDDFYEKELSLSVSCSFGPGRYDPQYEDRGRDYPLPFVRWTEKRNFEAVLQLMADGQLDPLPLVTHRFAFEDAPSAYDVIGGPEPTLGIVLSYGPGTGDAPGTGSRTIRVRERSHRAADAEGVGVIGAGNFAVRTLLPVLKEEGARLRTIVSSRGTSGAVAARKFGFQLATTDTDTVLDDASIGTLFVLTRHDTHADLAVRALEAGKHVFVEKPLALSEVEIDRVVAAAEGSGQLLMVGFNRRFAPLTQQAAEKVERRTGPLAVVATVNAGAIPRDHWTQDPSIGGGRILGEAVHWIDLARSLVGEPIKGLSVTVAGDGSGHSIDDIAHLSLAFQDGSTAVVHYLANGPGAYPKERVDCFWDGKAVSIDNWRKLRRFGVRGPLFEMPRRMDKGHVDQVHEWMTAVREGRASPIPLEEIAEVSRWAVRAGQLARAGGGAWEDEEQS